MSTRAERLAVALWEMHRRELQGHESIPAFYEYADGAREPMPFAEQGKRFQNWWRKRAERLLREITCVKP